MSGIKNFDPTGWDITTVAAAKAGCSVSVCIPCRNEAGSVGDLVRMIDQTLVGTLVDELIVLDDGSTDGSADIAREAGAQVVDVADIHAVHGPATGKGNALWASLLASEGDLVVWCDGDITSFSPDWIVRLVMPLLLDDEVGLVKASYHRPTHLGGGGRTTELVARPLLSLYLPELAGVDQPLAGEYAGRRSMLEQIPFATGWGVEIGMLIDMYQRFGIGSIGQVDLGIRLHRHHRLDTLAVQAAEVAAVLLAHVPDPPDLAGDVPTLDRRTGEPVVLNLGVRPPVASLGR